MLLSVPYPRRNDGSVVQKDSPNLPAKGSDLVGSYESHSRQEAKRDLRFF